MHIVGYPCVDAGAGDGQGNTVVDLNGVYGELGAVPQVLGVAEFADVAAEILEKIVARADGDDAHGGVIKADDAVGHFVHGAVAAAGVKAQLLAALAELFGQLCCVALPLGENALHVQVVPGAQRIRHVINALAAVGLTGSGIDNENMFHKTLQMWKRIRTHRSIIAGKKQNLCIN